MRYRKIKVLVEVLVEEDGYTSDEVQEDLVNANEDNYLSFQATVQDELIVELDDDEEM